MTQASRSSAPTAVLLGYQLRFREGPEPESLIATDVADALRQARRRAFLAQTPVSLWRDGALVAECVPHDADKPVIDAALLTRLVAAGFYVYGPASVVEGETSAGRDHPAP